MSEIKTGDYARDTKRDKVGQVMEVRTHRVFLRPVGGGCEWVCSRKDVRPVSQSEALREKVAAANKRSRGRL